MRPKIALRGPTRVVMKRALLICLLGPLMLGVACKPKKLDSVPVDNTVHVEPVSVALQVAGVDPAFGTANKSFPAEVYGSGFALSLIHI
jgi:hypothetical protein